MAFAWERPTQSDASQTAAKVPREGDLLARCPLRGPVQHSKYICSKYVEGNPHQALKWIVRPGGQWPFPPRLWSSYAGVQLDVCDTVEDSPPVVPELSFSRGWTDMDRQPKRINADGIKNCFGPNVWLCSRNADFGQLSHLSGPNWNISTMTESYELLVQMSKVPNQLKLLTLVIPWLFFQWGGDLWIKCTHIFYRLPIKWTSKCWHGNQLTH